MRSWREFDFIGPRNTLVVSADKGDGKTTAALQMAGRDGFDATWHTTGIDVVLTTAKGTIWDTPPPPNNYAVHPAVAAALLRDATHAVVVHRRNAAGTLRVVHAMRKLGIETIVWLRNADAKPDWRLAGKVNIVTSRRTMSFHVYVILPALTQAHLPTWAHVTMCAILCAARLLPRYSVRRGPADFLARASSTGARKYAKRKNERKDCAALVLRVAISLLALVAARACTWRQETMSPWAAYCLNGSKLALVMRASLAVQFAIAGIHAHVAAAAFAILVKLASWPLPAYELVAWVIAAAAINVHAGVAATFVIMQGNRSNNSDSALLAAGVVARNAHIAVTLGIVLLVAIEDNWPRIMLQPGLILPWLLLLMYF